MLQWAESSQLYNSNQDTEYSMKSVLCIMYHGSPRKETILYKHLHEVA